MGRSGRSLSGSDSRLISRRHFGLRRHQFHTSRPDRRSRRRGTQTSNPTTSPRFDRITCAQRNLKVTHGQARRQPSVETHLEAPAPAAAPQEIGHHALRTRRAGALDASTFGAHAVPASLASAANRLTTLPILERIQRLRLLVPQGGFEPPTPSLRILFLVIPRVSPTWRINHGSEVRLTPCPKK